MTGPDQVPAGGGETPPAGTPHGENQYSPKRWEAIQRHTAVVLHLRVLLADSSIEAKTEFSGGQPAAALVLPAAGFAGYRIVPQANGNVRVWLLATGKDDLPKLLADVPCPEGAVAAVRSDRAGTR
jgi:hypothetical protein